MNANMILLGWMKYLPDTIYPALNEALSVFSKGVLEAQSEVVEKVKKDPSSRSILSEGRSLYDDKSIEIIRADSDALSIESSWMVYYYGPHEYYSFEGASFDSKTGKKLALGDVVKSRDELIPVIKQYLVENYEDDLMLDPNDESDSRHMDERLKETDYSSKWLLTNDGIRIIFNGGEFSSYWVGSLTVDLSFGKYPDLLPENTCQVMVPSFEIFHFH